MDSVAIVAAARELFAARQFAGVVAACEEAVADLDPRDPAVIPLRLLAARSHLALRRDPEAQAEIRECLRADPHCGPAYRLLGELAARADELASAKVFLREALRLGPDDDEARDWLRIVENLARDAEVRARPVRPARPVIPPPVREVAAVPPVRPVAAPPPVRPPVPPRAVIAALPLPPRAPSAPPAMPRPLRTAHGTRAGSPPLPVASGFGQHLIDCGLLSPLQLKAALAYQKSTGVRLGAAAVALGFLSEPKIEWASLAYHGRHRAAS